MAELHANQYPYPAECVYLVTGGKMKDSSLDLSSLKSLIIVGRDAEAVSGRWLQKVKNADGMQAMSCASLSQISPLLEKLDAAIANAEGVTKIPTSGFFRFGQSAKQPWLVGLSTGQGYSKMEVVIAQSAEDIEDWASKKGLMITTVINHAVLQATAEEMRKVQNGTSPEEIYAEGPQDVYDTVSRISNRTPAEVKESEEGFSRRLAIYQGRV